MAQSIDTMICVLGGGPAGSIIAGGLAKLGYQTTLIERGQLSGLPRVESMAPPAHAIFASLGLGARVDAAVIARETQACVHWAGPHRETKTFDPPSLLIDRDRLDCALRTAAADAGVDVVTAKAGLPTRSDDGGWTVPLRALGMQRTIACRFLVDARGRRPARRSGVARTVAVRGIWRSSALRETCIATTENAWWWGSPCGDGRYSATLFLDAARAVGHTHEARRTLYIGELAQSDLFHPLLEGTLLDPLQVRDATPSIADTLIEDDMIRVGDAAFAIDPLSSQGLQATVLSAVQGTAAVHTILLGRNRAAAMQFYRTQQIKAAERAARHAARYYAARAAVSPTPFWQDRTPADVEATHRPAAAHPAALPRHVVRSPDLAIVEVPVLSGSLITLAPALHHPTLDEPVGYIGGIALAPLLADIDSSTASDEILSRWMTRMQPRTARHIMQWMCGTGVLVPQAASHRSATR